jgi:PKD repeat protein
MKSTTTKTIKKLLLLGTLAIFFASTNIAFAGLCDDISSGTGGWISCGEEATSFTEFEGGLKAPSEKGYDEGITRVTTLREYAINVTNFVLGFLGLVGVIMVIYGGFLYLTAAGETDQMDKGKKAIIYAIVGILIVMASFAIVNTVIQAPTGEEKEGVATEQEIAVSRSQRSFNLLANKVKTLATDLITAYQYHVEVANELEATRGAIRLIEDISKGNLDVADNWNNFAKGRVNGKKDDFEKIQDRYKAIADMSKSTLLRNQIGKAELFWREMYDSTYSKAKKRAKSTGCLGCNWEEVDCDCSKGNLRDIFDDANEGVKLIRSFLTGDGDPDVSQAQPYTTTNIGSLATDGYLSENTKDTIIKDIKLTKYDNETTTEDCTSNIHVHTDCLKRYSAEEFFSEVNEIKSEIAGIYEQVGEVTSIGSEHFEALITNTKDAVSGVVTITEAGGLLQNIKTDIKDDNVADAETKIKETIGTMVQLIEALKNIQFVDAVISADLAEGNAPLIVNFSAIDSYDPSQLSIGEVESPEADDIQVQWDLDGNGEYDFVNDLIGDVECFNHGDSKDSGLTPYCIYKTPGQYRVGLKVKSSHAKNPVTGRTYDKEIAEGRAYMTIKVNPPTTKINLSVPQVVSKNSGTGKLYIRKYDADGNLLVDRDKVTFTPNEAKAGIEFDISTSAQFSDQGPDYIKRVKWDFGDDVVQEEYDDPAAPNPNPKTNGMMVTHQYPPGRYTVTLEVTNKKNQTDRVIFDVIIKEIKADLRVTPDGEINVGQEITIDGSESKTDIGKIVDYTWSATGVTLPTDADGKTKLTAQVDKTGPISITLTVKNNNPDGGQTDTVTVNLFAESKPPVASFKYLIPYTNKPSEIHFDASQSYDPDIAETSELVYEWDFDGVEGTDFEFVDGDVASKRSIVLYKKKGTYNVKLKVHDPDEVAKVSEAVTPVEIKNILSAWWPEGQQISAQLALENIEDVEVDGEDVVQPKDNKPEATIDFSVEQMNGSYAEWDFGDGEMGVTEEVSGIDAITKSHTYTESGKYKVNVTVFDKDDSDLIISRMIYIGDGENPIAAPRIYVDGAERFDFENYPAGEHEIEVTRKSVVTFDASDSLNIDGSGRKLTYEWQFGDGDNSTQKMLTHTYKDVDLMVGGEIDEETGRAYKRLPAKLVVRDKDDSTKKDEVNMGIKVVSAAPTLKSLSAVIEGDSVETPLEAKVEAIGSEDEDGKIVQYKWFYFDVDESDVILGQQITKTSSTKIKIGPRGDSGDEKTYRFDVEMTDDENTKIFASEILPANMLPTVTVVNGPNDPPEAKFNVDRTSIGVGEVINFVSSSTDPDGDIVEYMWDLDGDGFENDEWTDETMVEFKFTKSKKDGIKIRLKVRDNNYTESVSKPITIYVTSDAEEPTAAFKAEQVEETKQVKFTNNSKADEENGAYIEGYIWDFDTISLLKTADTDGDGEKENDTDSAETHPLFTYDEYGTYKIKLTVIDSEGSEDEVTNIITLKAPEVPEPPAPTEPSQPSQPVAPTQPTDPAQPVDPAQPADPVDPAAPSQGGDPVTLDARLITNPPTNPLDNRVHLEGTAADVEFNFSESVGNIIKYAIDKNVYYDTNGNGVNDDDEDFTSQFPIKWTTHFEQSWGKTMAKLTVYDAFGNKDEVTKEIVFDGDDDAPVIPPMGVSGSANIFTAGDSKAVLPVLGVIMGIFLIALAIKFKEHGK